MPYHIGAKGSNGCSGYPVVSDKGQVAGCHETESEATAQLGALYANVADATKSENSMIQTSSKPENPSDFINPEAGMKKPATMPRRRRKKKTENKAVDPSMMTQEVIKEGDFVMGMTSEGMVHGMVEHIMIEGGVYGVPGTEYAIQSMPPENPAMAVRIYEEEDGKWEPTAYSIGMMYKDAEIIDINNHSMEDDEEDYDSEVAMAMYDSSIGKSEDYYSDDEEMDKWDNITKACWVGYTQQGMKEKDGRMVPNCVPVKKSNEMEDEMEKAKKPNYGEMIKPRSGGSKPTNPRLYATVVQAAKDRFDVYPSAVANAWVVQEYKRRGGTYSSEKSISLDLWSGQFDPRKFNK
jgi:hypothetical protein